MPYLALHSASCNYPASALHSFDTANVKVGPDGSDHAANCYGLTVRRYHMTSPAMKLQYLQKFPIANKLAGIAQCVVMVPIALSTTTANTA